MNYKLNHIGLEQTSRLLVQLGMESTLDPLVAHPGVVAAIQGGEPSAAAAAAAAARRESNERDASANRVRPRRPTHCPLHSPEFAAFPQLLRKLRALLSRRDTCEKESEVRSENHSEETYLGAWTYLHISAQSPPLRSPGRGQGHWGATMSGR